MEERKLTDNQKDLMATKVRHRVVNAILPAMSAEVAKIFGVPVHFSVSTVLRPDADSSDISFRIGPCENHEKITFSLQLTPDGFSDKAFSHLADRALELFTSEVEE